jgi:hypothetical protein
MAETVGMPRQILVLYQEEETQPGDGSKGIFSNVRQKVMKVAPLNVDEFANNLQDLCNQMGDALARITPATGGYQLESFELAVEVTAKGEVKFIGSVGTDLKGGVKLVFRRK